MRVGRQKNTIKKEVTGRNKREEGGKGRRWRGGVRERGFEREESWNKEERRGE